MSKLPVVFAFVFLVTINAAFAQLNTSGVLTEDITWSGAVNVLGDITVSEGVTLTIEPGTMVRFAARSDRESSGENTVLTEFTVSGVLIAKGTADKMINFTSELMENPVPGD